MKYAELALRNAANLTSQHMQRRKERIGRWMVKEEHSLSPDEPTLPSLTNAWKQESFWVPDHTPCGFPVIVVGSRAIAQAWEERLLEEDVRCALAQGEKEALSFVFTSVVIMYNPSLSRAHNFFGPPTTGGSFINWLKNPYSLGTPHSDAYSKFVNMPHAHTEDVLGLLGPYIWAEFDSLVAEIEPRGEVDPRTWEVFWSLIGKGKAAEAVRVGDMGTTLTAQAEKWTPVTRMTKEFNNPRNQKLSHERIPERSMSKPLWKRELRFKKRHYFDVATLLVITRREWERNGCGELFGKTSKLLLYHAVRSGMGYERLYLTMAWLWTNPYWWDLAQHILEKNLLYATDAQWTKICKEQTAQIAKSWFFPGTNVQHIASAYFLNAENLWGYTDKETEAGEAGAVTLEILKFATDHFEYNYPTDAHGNRDFSAYMVHYKRAVARLLEPLYARYADKAMSRKEVIDTRVANAPSGAAGKRAKELLGPEVAPQGSSKGYVMAMSEASAWYRDWGTTFAETDKKNDERAAWRTLVATDMFDYLDETVAFKVISNRYAEVGLDVGESPLQAMARHINLATSTERDDKYVSDGKTLMCWDWQAWDHFIHNSERALKLQAMRELTERYIQGQPRKDMLEALDRLLEGTEELVFRSRHYADERYRKDVDEIIAQSNGQAERLPGYAGNFAVRIAFPHGQQSGRKSTLEGNTIMGTSRLIVRDDEMLAKNPKLGPRVSLFRCNRADDVAEVFDRYWKAAEAVTTMLRQGHKANPKKQVVQVGTMVYLRNLYANGTVRAFPSRATYAAFTGHPDKGAGVENTFYDKLSSVADGMDMAVRRGLMHMDMARALYDDARNFFSSFRQWLTQPLKDGRNFVRVRIAREVLEAAPEHGGVGILPPGRYTYDYRIKCSGSSRWRSVAKDWTDKLQAYVAKLAGKSPGIRDLTITASDRFTEATGIPLNSEVKQDFRGRWANARVHQSGDGQTRFVERQAAIAKRNRKWHIDKKDSHVPALLHYEDVEAGIAAFARACTRARLEVNSAMVKLELQEYRGLPAYGVFGHEWFGYAEIMLARAKNDVHRALLMTTMASATHYGQAFLDNAYHWPFRARLLHLTGNLGPAGAWSKLVPASWSGFVQNQLQYCLAMLFERYPHQFTSTYTILRARATITENIVRAFYSANQGLFLH